MTVIAAVSLFDGVMLMADCRATVTWPGRRTIHSDTALKILPLTPTVALAFSGDIAAAGMIIPAVIRHLRLRRRLNTVSVLQWLPRFLKETYRRMVAKPPRGRRYGAVQFIVAATIPDRTNVVDRARVADIVRRAVSSESTMQRNWMPDRVMRVLMAPAELTSVPIPGAPACVLGTMRSPDFKLQTVPSLSCVAIGSGGGAVVEMERAADWLLSSEADIMVKMGLESVVQDFIAQDGIESVGGMYPCVKLDRVGVSALGTSMRLPLYELSLAVEPKSRRWVQENLTTGKKQPLLFPWEFMKSLPHTNRRFDDYREAWEDFNPRRGKRPPA